MSIHCLKYWFLLCAYVVQYTVKQLFFLFVWTTNAILLASVRKKCCSKFPRIIDPSTIVIHKRIYRFISVGFIFGQESCQKSVLSQRNRNVHCHTAKVELNWKISVGISTCAWPSVILKYWNAQGFDVYYILFTAGIPCLAYGIAASMFIQHKELVQTPCGDVFVYFLYEEDKGSKYWYTKYTLTLSSQ